MTLVLTPGQRHEATVFEQLMEAGAVKPRGAGRPKRRPHRIIGDKGYSSRRIRRYARQHGIRIPSRASATKVVPGRSIEPFTVSAIGASA
jgi:Transposase DDE domain